MKKIYTLLTIITVAFSANAQQRSTIARVTDNSAHVFGGTTKVLPMAATGDTLMYMPLPETYVVDPNDNASFSIITEDTDGLTTYNQGAPTDWGVYYSTDSSLNSSMNPIKSNYYHPWEDETVDSAFFWSATSWFNPAGQANNWLMFGPITLAQGGILKWYDRTNPSYRDGYKVYATLSASSPLISSDFVDAPFYTKTSAAPSPTAATDTTWVQRTAVIPPAYEMNSIYIAFQHDANDKDVLRIDEILVVESPLSINENTFVNGVKVTQNSPNPYSNSTSIAYELQKNASLVSLFVYDVTGKVVAEQLEGNQQSGKHLVKFNANSLPAGIYYYSLMIDNNFTATQKMVVLK